MRVDACEAAARKLHAAGFDAWLTGLSALAYLGEIETPVLNLSTNAPPERLLALFPAAAVVAESPRVIALPAARPALRIASREPGQSIDRALAPAVFRIEVFAVALPSGERLDPHAGLADWRAKQLRAAAAVDRLAADPGSALRAARLCAEHALDPEPELARAFGASAQRVAELAVPILRSEIARVLLAPDPARGLRLLRSAALEDVLVPGVRGDAHAVVAALPAERGLRLLGWLRGSNVGRALRRLQIPPLIAAPVERLLQYHPIDRDSAPAAKHVATLERRVGKSAIESLLALRDAELATASAPDPAARDRLAALHVALASARERKEPAPPSLCVTGRDLIEALGWEPGPRIGVALRRLVAHIERHPDQNEREKLLALVRTPAFSDSIAFAARDEPRGERW